jgi:tetratricopeptide (TPR) repeat protein
MHRSRTALFLAPLLAACAGNPDRHTLAELHRVEPDMTEVRVENSLDQAMMGYRKFLEEAPESSLTPEAMRRLADLKLEKEYGILGGAQIREMPAPEPGAQPPEAGSPETPERSHVAGIADLSESQEDFERRAAAEQEMAGPQPQAALDLPGGKQASSSGPLEAIALYDEILAAYPDYEHNDQVLYQKARAFDELGRVDEAVAVIDRLIAEYPGSRHIDEVQFRRAEYYFTRKKWLDAEDSYLAITRMGQSSDYYELALYKLGWTFYKQEMHEEALHEYVALLDYKVSTGYDFDQSEDENDGRRISDTFRVISLSFSSLGGPEAVEDYFTANGHRSYEDRIYSHLGEFYLEKLRYADAAAAYEAFVTLNPLHRSSPLFSMRVVEIYEAGGFPKLVLESKKDFAARYGLDSEYWRHSDVAERPEVLSYLQRNLEDLASHYHALYQDAELAEDKPANFSEALRWYRAYLSSFPEDEQTPSINQRLADLLLENENFGEAAREYERTAYEYPKHQQSSAAGYAAIYAHREHEKAAAGEEKEQARREAVASTLRFVDTFPEHEHAAAVLGAAADDLYDMQDYETAIATGRRLIEQYPGAELPIRRDAWAVVAHASFELADYPQAEDAYSRVLEMTQEDDPKRQAVVDNLAASIYKQGEQANLAEDYRAAADHFLRIAKVAPTSAIRPAAEYDAGAALIKLEAWAEAAEVLDAFREAYPEHELHQEATKQIAFVYREEGDLSRAAGEYERVADEAEDPELRGEALLLAGDLYEESSAVDDALSVYLRYVKEFPEPLETAVETRFKIAGMYADAGDEKRQHEQLEQIVAIDRKAGDARTPRVRYLAARSALVLTEGLYDRFDEVALVQPFERSLKEKQRRMDAALDGFGALVDYEVGEVTAAATFYMAQVYYDFSRALMESERPAGLSTAEMQDYEMTLEESAFPFEERAIEVHQKNLELMSAGVYNAWIEKSLARLAELMPGRYAKFEASSGFLESVDTYAYRAPNAPDPAMAEAELAGGSPEAEAAPEGGEVSPAAEPEVVEVSPAAEPEVVEVSPASEPEVVEVSPASDDATATGEALEAEAAPEVVENSLAAEPEVVENSPAAEPESAPEGVEVSPASDDATATGEALEAEAAPEVVEVSPAAEPEAAPEGVEVSPAAEPEVVEVSPAAEPEVVEVSPETDEAPPANAAEETDEAPPANAAEETDEAPPANAAEETDEAPPANAAEETDEAPPANAADDAEAPMQGDAPSMAGGA